GYEVLRIPVAEARSGTGRGLATLRDRWRVPAQGAGERETRLVLAPTQLHRAVLGLLEALNAAFISGSVWSIELVDPLDVAVKLLPPYLQILRALDGLYGTRLAPDEIFVQSGPTAFLLARAADYEPTGGTTPPRGPDVVLRLECMKSPVDALGVPHG